MTKTRNAMLVGALAGAMLATPVLAAQNDCVQRNRIWTWRAFDGRTLIVTDRTYKRYTVEVTSGCLGLTDGNAHFVVPTWSNLSCLNVGDPFSVSTPQFGLTTCTISGVHAGTPPPAPG